jgi:hypothetical protein
VKDVMIGFYSDRGDQMVGTRRTTRRMRSACVGGGKNLDRK